MFWSCADYIYFHSYTVHSWHFEAKGLDTQHAFWIEQKKELKCPCQRKGYFCLLGLDAYALSNSNYLVHGATGFRNRIS